MRAAVHWRRTPRSVDEIIVSHTVDPDEIERVMAMEFVSIDWRNVDERRR